MQRLMHNLRGPALTLALMLMIHPPAHSDPPNMLLDGGINVFLATTDRFSITVADQVKDGCLPRPGALKDAMEVSLRKSGFQIDTERQPLGKQIIIVALGYARGADSCVVSLRAELRLWMLSNVPHMSNDIENRNTLILHSHLIGHDLLSGSKSTMQKRLEDASREYADTLFLSIRRAQDDIFLKFPRIKEGFEGLR